MDIAQLVKQARGDRTQERFAQDLGCSRQTVVWWETGKFVPSKDWLEKLGIAIEFRAVPISPPLVKQTQCNHGFMNSSMCKQCKVAK